VPIIEAKPIKNSPHKREDREMGKIEDAHPNRRQQKVEKEKITETMEIATMRVPTMSMFFFIAIIYY
jgi:hypothetical protein